MAKTGLEEFKTVVSEFRSLTALAVNSSVVAPLAALVMNIGPPWPPGVPIVTSFAELIVLITAFHFWYGQSRKRISRRMRIALATLCVGFFAYMFLFDSFTFSPKNSNDKEVKGFVVRADVKPLLNDRFTTDNALEESEYNPSNVWQAWSVTAMRVMLLAAWLLLFVSLSIFVATFVMYQRSRIIKSRPAAT